MQTEKILALSLPQARELAVKLAVRSSAQKAELILLFGHMYSLLSRSFSAFLSEVDREYLLLSQKEPTLPRPIYRESTGQVGIIGSIQARKYCSTGALLLSLKEEQRTLSSERCNELLNVYGIEKLALYARHPRLYTTQDLASLDEQVQALAQEHKLKISQLCSAKAFATHGDLALALKEAQDQNKEKSERARSRAQKTALAIVGAEHFVVEKSAPAHVFAKLLLEKCENDLERAISALRSCSVPERKGGEIVQEIFRKVEELATAERK